MDYRKLVTNPNAYYLALSATGWLDEWNDSEIELLTKALEEIHNRAPEHLIFALCEYSLNPDGICTPEDYKNAVLSLFSAFNLAIDTSEIKAEKAGSKISLTVANSKGRVNWLFTQEDDWLHDDFLDFINDEVLPLWDEDKVFHPLPPAESTIDIVFQYPEVIEAAYEAGIIPEDDFFLTDRA